MSKVRSVVLSLLLMAGLAACGQNAATAQNANATESGDPPVAVTAPRPSTDTTVAAPAVASPAAPAETKVATVATLPLKRGYYVDSDTSCGQASNATTMLLRRDGLGGSRDFCEFKRIEQAGPNLYRVTETCGDLQDNASAETSVTTYTLKGDTSFTSKSEHGWERSARHCAQSSMPADFRANDISDVTG